MSLDTSPDAEAIQLEIFRRMTPAQRFRVAEMSESMCKISLAGLRSRHPEMTEKELLREFVRVTYGITLPT